MTPSNPAGSLDRAARELDIAAEAAAELLLDLAAQARELADLLRRGRGHPGLQEMVRDLAGRIEVFTAGYGACTSARLAEATRLVREGADNSTNNYM